MQGEQRNADDTQDANNRSPPARMGAGERLRGPPTLAELPGAAGVPCANPGASSGACALSYNPFIAHDFLWSLETSGSSVARTGWQPQHLAAEDERGEVLGVTPCYLKSHSRGEYVFDRGWAEAYERAGGAYYPKLQVSVPFTPATGRRLLVRPSPDADRIREGLTAGLIELCRMHQASSVHLTFLPEAESTFLTGHKFLHRTDQ